MLIVNVKENESIDKALKRFKKKFREDGRIAWTAFTDCFPKAVG